MRYLNGFLSLIINCAVYLIASDLLAQQNSVGRLIAWGNTMPGLNQGDLTNIVSIAATDEFDVAVRDNGTIAVWGKVMPTAIPTITNAQSVYGGKNCAIILTKDGSLIGLNTETPKSATNITMLTIGGRSGKECLAVKKSGELVLIYGSEIANISVRPDATNDFRLESAKIISIAFSRQGKKIALLDDGKTILQWEYGGLKAPTRSRRPIIQIAANVDDYAGRSPFLFLKYDGKINLFPKPKSKISMGISPEIELAQFHSGPNDWVVLDAYGRLGAYSTRENSPVTRLLPIGLSNVVNVSVASDHAIAIVGNGGIYLANRILTANRAPIGGQLPAIPVTISSYPVNYQWYKNTSPIEGANSRRPEFVIDSEIGSETYRLIISNAVDSIMIPMSVKTSSIHVWGSNSAGQFSFPEMVEEPIKVASGGFHNLALTASGKIVAWGKNSDHQNDCPTDATNIIDVAAGGGHSLGLTDLGRVLAWGKNEFRQCNVPVNATNVISIAAGAEHSIALKADGSVLAWGNNDYGQGTGNSDSSFIAIASGYYHNLALRSDGTVTCWGLYDDIPSGISNIISIAAGFNHNIATKSDGSVIAWGDNSFGQCDVPPSATNVVQVSAGYYHSIARRSDGTLVMWGKNIDRFIEYPSNIKGFREISSGEDHAIGIVDSGKILIGRYLNKIGISPRSSLILAPNIQAPIGAQIQWFLNDQIIVGQTNRALNIRNAEKNDFGSYHIQVSSHVEVAQSLPITVENLRSDMDWDPPALALVQPISGTVEDQRFNLSGTASDAVTLRAVRWTWNGISQGELPLSAGGFSVGNLNLYMGTNLIEVTAEDAAGNASVVQREVVWKPIRTLIAGSAVEVQEGQRIVFPISMVSTGDVGGLAFKLNYNPAFLTDPKVDWSAVVGQSVNTVNTSVAGEISGSFSLPGTALASGTAALGTVDFRARSVPAQTNVVLSPAIVSVANPSGTLLATGNGAIAGEGRIRPRKIKGDNNANQRIDIGDAVVVSRLLVGSEETRSWDVGLNDLNASQSLDNGDVIKALRTVVGLDPQPSPGSEGKRLSNTLGLAKVMVNTNDAIGIELLDGAKATIGQPYRVAVRLNRVKGNLSGVSFALKYPASLSLTDKQVGAMVPGNALPFWNESAGQVSLAAIRSTAWANATGVAAVLTFVPSAAFSGQAEWPLKLEQGEITGSGFDVRPMDPVVVVIQSGGGTVSTPPQISLQPPKADGSITLEILASQGATVAVETTGDLNTWVETQRVTGQGNTTPVKVTLQADPNVQAKFWRVRVR